MKPAGPAKTRRSLPPSASDREIVLYVEDDPDNCQVAKYRLEKRYDLRCASNDREACERLTELGSRISLVLLDIELRGSQLDGLQLARVLRGRADPQRLPAFARDVPVLDVPIIFVTAHVDRYRVPELILAGGSEVILKPVDFVALHGAMTRAYLGRKAAGP